MPAAPANHPESYLDPRTLEKIKRLDLRARLVVEGFITGGHRSPYNGFAIEFAGHREYSPGDELKHIDWKVWSKTDRLYIKEYEEETNLTSTMVVDCSKSMAYGKGWRKFDHAATAAASLAHLLQGQQDPVGLVTFNTKVEKIMPPSSRTLQLKAMVHELGETEPGSETDVSSVFAELPQHIKRRGLVAIFSDFFADRAAIAEALKQFRLRRHEVIVFHVLHNDEVTFPFDDNTRFLGLESDDQVHADPRALRKSYLKIFNEYQDEVKKICATVGADYAVLNTSEPLDAALSRYLAFRKKHTRRV
ncbi:MAG: DUF58 domain-containing protein [Verrucomicrobiales bacterium]